MKTVIIACVLALSSMAYTQEDAKVDTAAKAKANEVAAKKNAEWQRHLEFLRYLDMHDSK